MYYDQMFITRVAVATLNQLAMDFDNNMQNIIKSIKIAKAKGCTYRVGPELEICGYSCEDHFLENDTVQHCWEVLYEILNSDLTNDIIIDLGMPVVQKNVFYNCRVICYNKEIMLIRPKQSLADDGNYRESRWFTPWSKTTLEDYQLPEIIWKVKGQKSSPFGVAILKTMDSEIGIEMCEELWVPQPTSTQQALDGAEIIVNSSASYFQLRKLHDRTDLIKDITKRNGAAYLYANSRGCDGNRTYFDGASYIVVNGHIFKSSEIFSLKDVEVITCDLDLSQVRNHRINLKARSLQAAKCLSFPRIHIPTKITRIQFIEEDQKLTHIDEPTFTEGEQMAFSIGCYLWDYLRRSGANGYFLALSGGSDSAAAAICVFYMCQLVYKTINGKPDEYGTQEQVLKEFRKIIKEPQYIPKSVNEMMCKVLHSAYLGSPNSSKDSRTRASKLAEQLGNTHYEVEIDEIFKSFRNSIKPIFKEEPKFLSQGGKTNEEDLALQNVQARSRMVLSYLLAQLAPWNEGKQGFLLVLGTSNLDEGLRGYLTKYDCSSADINPLGSLTKKDLRKFLLYTAKEQELSIVFDILEAGASAELKPAQSPMKISHGQNSEEEMGMTFDELETFGKLRKIHRLGPFSMFRRLLSTWSHLKPGQVAEKVKSFFVFYAVNRHKVVTLTPAFHAEVQ